VAWELINTMRDSGATVILVTHFMDEAEILCDRVAVVKDGRILVVGTPSELRRDHGGAVRVRFTAPLADSEFLAHVDGVADVKSDGDAYEITGSGPILARVAAALVARGIEPDDLEVVRPSLDEVYLRLTGSPDPATDADGALS
jgi:ABC-2 type transport system ATP-binding protein